VTVPRTITVCHSPDSDDAFMFYALAAGKIDTGDLRYEHELQDIESLNQRALRGELEVTAVSIHAYAYLSDRYALLPHGASMGDRYGPRLVARTPMSKEDIKGKRIAIPGSMTSAFRRLRYLSRMSTLPSRVHLSSPAKTSPKPATLTFMPLPVPLQSMWIGSAAATDGKTNARTKRTDRTLFTPVLLDRNEATLLIAWTFTLMTSTLRMCTKQSSFDLLLSCEFSCSYHFTRVGYLSTNCHSTTT
jgi:hypothetical protein